MGYTHYYSFNVAPKGKASQVEAKYKKAIQDCQKIVLAYSKEFGGLSGYSAHTKLGQYGGINFNGSREEGHEDFILREHFSENGSNFCKTANKPYDLAVTACLIALKSRLGNLVEIDSDGRKSDFHDGLKLACKVLKLKKLAIPVNIRD